MALLTIYLCLIVRLSRCKLVILPVGTIIRRETTLLLSLRTRSTLARYLSLGTGKSSLINFILGSIGVSEVSSSYSRLISEGKYEITKDLIISYISQDTSHLKGDITNFCNEYEIDKSLFCSLLVKLDFEKYDFLKDIKDYSAGQKKKIFIAKSLLTPAHIYIWDEPLNFLDIFSRVRVEDVVKDFDPTILFIEHDVKFKTTIANKIVTL